MNVHDTKTLLVATDLEAASNVVVGAAAALAHRVGGALHVLHALEGSTGDERREEALRAIDRQIDEAAPAGLEVASRVVVPGPAVEAIERRAREVGADLLVLGPHGRSDLAARVLGSTAERILRSSDVPCLVVRGNLRLPLRRVGVPVDFSEPACAAVRVAVEWAPLLTSGRPGEDPPVRLVHVGWPVTRIDLPDYEETTLLPRLEAEVERATAAAGVEVGAAAEVLWDNRPPQRISRWAARHEIDLLVLGTHGRSGLGAALLGSMATHLARQAPCSVILVPAGRPAAPARRAPALERVLLGTDFSSAAAAAASWVAAHIAPDAELVLAHAVDVPSPPFWWQHGAEAQEELVTAAVRDAEERLNAAAAGLPRPPAERLVRVGRGSEVLTELARRTGADLVAVGGHGRQEGLWSSLGSTAENLLATCPAPVLVARGGEARPPRSILVAVDDSLEARDALACAVLLAGRSDAELVLLHVLSAGLMSAIRRVSSAPKARSLANRAHDEARRWIAGLARKTELPEERVTTVVEEGVPSLQILAATARLGCDVAVLGSRGSGGVHASGLGSVARSVVRHAMTSVLIVPPPRP